MVQLRLNMKILAFSPSHDAGAAIVEDGVLTGCMDVDKDSGERHGRMTCADTLNVMTTIGFWPDVLAVSGAVRMWFPRYVRSNAGYFGHATHSVQAERRQLLGKQIDFFSAPHERSHILCAYGMWSAPQGTPAYALVWEGRIGAFFEIDEQLRIHRIGNVLRFPGDKYCLPYIICRKEPFSWDLAMAGKVMALAGFARSEGQVLDKTIIDMALDQYNPYDWSKFLEFATSSPYAHIGVESQACKQLCRDVSDAIFNRFYRFAERHLTKRLPLLICGGCGLNCEWNTKWRMCGLFPEVFVPPCTDDSGIAIGVAVSAQWHYTTQAKIAWTPYCGESFICDVDVPEEFVATPLDLSQIAGRLAGGDIIAWVQGRCEMGPRALGNRSILAAPFDVETSQRLNRIKQRESFRPIAPVCLEEDVGTHFAWSGPSPHMLYFQIVRSPALRAITHVDGSARCQTVTYAQQPRLYEMLREFKKRTGYGVLCNTSLNYKGRGFINRMSDLVKYVQAQGLEGMVVGNRAFFRSGKPQSR